MKAFYKLLIMLLVVSLLTGSLAGCDIINQITGKEDTENVNQDVDAIPGDQEKPKEEEKEEEKAPFIDYAAQLKFDFNSGRKYIETTVRSFIDGDTTHFKVPTSIDKTGVLKARYLGVNTPESTGQIEPWGKKASKYTRDALEEATSIIIESDDDKWNHDSTGERYLVWVWYKTADMENYRNLNLELLQAGLSRASSYLDTSYGDICAKAFNQAVNNKLLIFSNEKDEDFYYGAAQTVTLKELKTNIEAYANQRVAFEGVVVKEYDNSTVYIEEYDEETGVYFGMQVFYGYNLNFFGKTILTVGNRVRMAGSVQYFENGGTWQISDIKYNPYDPESSENIKLISEGHAAAYPELDANTILNGKLNFEFTSEDKDGNEIIKNATFDYGYIALHSTASLKGLKIIDIYTTKQGSSAGAMSITCLDKNGDQIIVRTVILLDDSTNPPRQVTEADFPIGSTIDVYGVIDCYEGEYQIKLLTFKDVTVYND